MIDWRVGTGETVLDVAIDGLVAILGASFLRGSFTSSSERCICFGASVSGLEVPPSFIARVVIVRIGLVDNAADSWPDIFESTADKVSGRGS
jgi:hypothetical protein